MNPRRTSSSASAPTRSRRLAFSSTCELKYKPDRGTQGNNALNRSDISRRGRVVARMVGCRRFYHPLHSQIHAFTCRSVNAGVIPLNRILVQFGQSIPIFIRGFTVRSREHHRKAFAEISFQAGLDCIYSSCSRRPTRLTDFRTFFACSVGRVP